MTDRLQRIQDRHHARERYIAHSKRRERMVILSAVAIAIALTMWFGSY